MYQLQHLKVFFQQHVQHIVTCFNAQNIVTIQNSVSFESAMNIE